MEDKKDFSDVFKSVVGSTISELDALLKEVVGDRGEDGELWFGGEAVVFKVGEVHYSPLSVIIDEDGDIMAEFVCNGLSLHNQAVTYYVQDMSLFFLIALCEFVCENV